MGKFQFICLMVNLFFFGDTLFYIFTFALMPRGHLLSFSHERK